MNKIKGNGGVLLKRLLTDVMLSGLQNGIQWETREGNFVSHGEAVLWRKLGIPINLGHNGVRVCLVEGVLIDVMLSIPLMQGTAKGLMVCSEYPAWSGDHSHHVGIINRTLADRLSKSWQSSCDHKWEGNG